MASQPVAVLASSWSAQTSVGNEHGFAANLVKASVVVVVEVQVGNTHLLATSAFVAELELVLVLELGLGFESVVLLQFVVVVVL